METTAGTDPVRAELHWVAAPDVLGYSKVAAPDGMECFKVTARDVLGCSKVTTLGCSTVAADLSCVYSTR